MTYLLERSAAWTDRGLAGEVAGKSNRYRFWTKGGNFRRRGLEIYNSFGFSLRLCDHESKQLHIHLLWPSIFIEVGKAHPDGLERMPFGFSFHRHEVHYRFFGDGRVRWYPWRQFFHEQEVLMQDGESFEKAAHIISGERDKQDAVRYQSVEDFKYFTGHEVQEGKALIRVERRRSTIKYLKWLYRAKWQYFIDIEFNREVGSRAGSWKGGTVGCSYEIRKGETPPETFRRMMRERKFR